MLVQDTRCFIGNPVSLLYMINRVSGIIRQHLYFLKTEVFNFETKNGGFIVRKKDYVIWYYGNNLFKLQGEL